MLISGGCGPEYGVAGRSIIHQVGWIAQRDPVFQREVRFHLVPVGSVVAGEERAGAGELKGNTRSTGGFRTKLGRQ